MEKFNTWADSYTGIQPFLPLSSQTHSLSSTWQLLYCIKTYLVGPILALIKFPFILLTLLSLVLLDTLGHILPVPLSRPCLRVVHFIFGRTLLFLLGFFVVDAKYVPSKRGNKVPNETCGSGFTTGHIIVANHCSYVDLIYLLYKFSPQFTAAPNTWIGDVPKGKVLPVSFYRALMNTIYQPEYKAEQTTYLGSVLEDVQTKKLGPLVLFPEATTTNGKVLLGCVPVITKQESLKVVGKIHVLGFKYEYIDFSPVYPAGSFFVHLFWLSSQFYNTLQVRYLIDADILIPETKEGNTLWEENLFDMLASTIGKRRAKITVTQKRPFLNYFYQYKKGYNKNN